MKRIILAALLVVTVGVVASAYYSARKGTRPAISTAVVSRGSIVDTVSATGTLQAVTTVQVGSQASGTISALYADFNSTVRRGQVIAQLDPPPLKGFTGYQNVNNLVAFIVQDGLLRNEDDLGAFISIHPNIRLHSNTQLPGRVRYLE